MGFFKQEDMRNGTSLGDCNRLMAGIKKSGPGSITPTEKCKNVAWICYARVCDQITPEAFDRVLKDRDVQMAIQMAEDSTGKISYSREPLIAMLNKHLEGKAEKPCQTEVLSKLEGLRSVAELRGLMELDPDAKAPTTIFRSQQLSEAAGKKAEGSVTPES